MLLKKTNKIYRLDNLCATQKCTKYLVAFPRNVIELLKRENILDNLIMLIINGFSNKKLK